MSFVNGQVLDAADLNSELFDTEWISIPLNGGFTELSPCQYRIKNGVIYFRGSVQGTIPAAGGAGVTVATLPPDARPAGFVRAVGVSSAGDVRRVNLSESGFLSLNASSSSAITWQSIDLIPPILN